jgi:hypothetical protein
MIARIIVCGAGRVPPPLALGAASVPEAPLGGCDGAELAVQALASSSRQAPSSVARQVVVCM